MSGSLFVQVPVGSGNAMNSNGLRFTRLPDLRIRAPKNDLAAGESVSFQVALFGSSTSQTIVWSTNQGSITSGGTYTAPGSLQSDAFAQVAACIQGTQTCDDLLLGLHPFKVGPTAPVVTLGNSLQMQALGASAPVSATWTQLTGGGVLSAAGLYTASTSPADGGGTPLTATDQGIQEQASIAVTGGFPGMVNRVSDYLNLATPQIQRVTTPLSVAVSGNRAYVLSAQDDSAALDRKLFYIDEYDLTDPVHPVWINAVEAAAAGQLHVFGSILYDIYPNGNGSLPSAMAAYDLSGASPVLVARRPLPQLFSWSFYEGVLTASETSSYSAGSSAIVDQFSLAGNSLIERQISLPPAIPGAPFSVAAVAATQSRLYVTEMNTSSASATGILAAYDMTTNPLTLLGTVSLPETTLAADAIITSSFLFTDQRIFNVTQDPPSPVGSLAEPLFEVLDANTNSILGRSYQNGMRIIDVRGPGNLPTVETLFDFVNAQQTAVFSGNYVYSAEAQAGLAIYDISAAGGPQFRNQMIVNAPPNNIVAVTQIANSTILAAAGCGSLDCEVDIFRLQNPAIKQATISTGTIPPNALALAANDLFVGTEGALLVFDVSQPTQPNQIGTIGTAMNALAASGGFLYAGTTDSRLVTYNIAAPASPTPTTSISLPDLAIQITISGNILLVADRTGGLLVFDISVPANPVLISHLTVPPAVLGVQVDGNFALLAALESGLVIVDLSTPSSPKIVSQTGLDSYNPFDPGLAHFPNRAAVIAIQGQIAFVGTNNFDTNPIPDDGNGMVYGFDYSQPQHPRLVSLAAYANQIAGWISSMGFAGADLFVAGFGVGLVEVDASQPRNTINLYYPQQSLRPAPLPPPPVPMVVANPKSASTGKI
jgi:hypothetical protein